MATQYKLVIFPGDTEPKIVRRLSDNAFIPFDPANRDYQEYLSWVAEGNQADPAEAPRGA